MAVMVKNFNDSEILSISDNRQITIPSLFDQMLGFGDEAECIIRGDALVIRPLKDSGEFAELILKDLVDEGWSGNELLDEFRRRQSSIRPAVKNMMDEARLIAEGKSEYGTYEDVFGEE